MPRTWHEWSTNLPRRQRTATVQALLDEWAACLHALARLTAGGLMTRQDYRAVQALVREQLGDQDEA